MISEISTLSAKHKSLDALWPKHITNKYNWRDKMAFYIINNGNAKGHNEQ